MKLLSQIFAIICMYALPARLLHAEPALLLAAQGDSILDGVTLQSAESPAIDQNGDVAFRALLKGSNVTQNNRVAIVVCSNGTPKIIIRAGDIDPNTGGIFDQLSDPILSSSGVLVFAGSVKSGTGSTTKRNSTGIWEYQNGTLSLIAQSGTPAPDFGRPPKLYFKNFDQIAVNDWGGVEFTASLQQAGLGNTAGLFVTRYSAGLVLVEIRGEEITDFGFGGFLVRFGDLEPLPHVSGQGRTMAQNGNYIRRPVFKALPSDHYVIRPFHYGLIFMDNNASDDVGESFPSFPPYGAQFKFREPIINSSNQTVFRTTIVEPGFKRATNTVIELLTNDISFAPFYQTLARTGDSAPGTSGATYSKLGDPVLNNNGQIAFLANVRGPKHSNIIGVWSGMPGMMQRIIAQGDIEAGGSGGRFADFAQIVLPDVGGVVIEAEIADAAGERKRGLWVAEQNRGLQRLLLEGDPLDFHGVQKKLKHFDIFKIAPHFSGQTRSFNPQTGSLVFRAFFTDGAWGIYEITRPDDLH